MFCSVSVHDSLASSNVIEERAGGSGSGDFDGDFVASLSACPVVVGAIGCAGCWHSGDSVVAVDWEGLGGSLAMLGGESLSATDSDSDGVSNGDASATVPGNWVEAVSIDAAAFWVWRLDD